MKHDYTFLKWQEVIPVGEGTEVDMTTLSWVVKWLRALEAVVKNWFLSE